jgi:hypothetical protein
MKQVVIFTEKEFEYVTGLAVINGNEEVLMKEGHECVFYNPSFLHNGFPQRMAFYAPNGFDQSVDLCVSFLEKHIHLITQIND